MRKIILLLCSILLILSFIGIANAATFRYSVSGDSWIFDEITQEFIETEVYGNMYISDDSNPDPGVYGPITFDIICFDINVEADEDYEFSGSGSMTFTRYHGETVFYECIGLYGTGDWTGWVGYSAPDVYGTYPDFKLPDSMMWGGLLCDDGPDYVCNFRLERAVPIPATNLLFFTGLIYLTVANRKKLIIFAVIDNIRDRIFRYCGIIQ